MQCHYFESYRAGQKGSSQAPNAHRLNAIIETYILYDTESKQHTHTHTHTRVSIWLKIPNSSSLTFDDIRKKYNMLIIPRSHRTRLRIRAINMLCHWLLSQPVVHTTQFIGKWLMVSLYPARYWYLV